MGTVSTPSGGVKNKVERKGFDSTRQKYVKWKLDLKIIFFFGFLPQQMFSDLIYFIILCRNTHHALKSSFYRPH